MSTAQSTSLTLASRAQMPYIGFGLWKADPSTLTALVERAIDIGYRHFDSACDYGNERQTGQGLANAIQAGKVRREELFVTSKLWCTDHAAEHVEPALDRILSDLQLQYLDLFLIHFPISLEYVPHSERYPPGWSTSGDPKHSQLSGATIQETWQAMEKLLNTGKVKHIGISNFNCALIQDLMRYAKVKPAVNQIESHPLLTCTKLIEFCQRHSIAVTAFSPFGSTSYWSIMPHTKSSTNLLTHPAITAIGDKHGKTAAQVLLRWQIERNVCAIPKSSSAERLQENLSVFDFRLTSDECAAISALNENRRFNDPGEFAGINIWD